MVAPGRHTEGAGWDGHVLLLYASEDERRAGLAAWVQRGLDRGEQVLCTQTGADPPGCSVLAVLAAQGVDVEAASADGHFVLLSLHDFYAPVGGHGGLVDRALSAGFSGARLSAEAAAALSLMDQVTYAGLEHAMDAMTRTRPVSAMCQYDRAGTTGERLDHVVAMHPVGLRERQLSSSSDSGCVALTGEVDHDNDEVLAALLRVGTRACADGTLRVDLSGITFMDVAACRALTTGTQRFRAAGGELLLLGPRPGVQRLLALLGVDRLDGVQVVGGPAS